MVSPFLVFRAFVFGLFIVFNTILCSLGAWNLGFADAKSRVASVDALIIFNGALGLVVIFPIIFTEVIRRGALTSRVWFELTWLTPFWILNFAAAVAVSCIAPDEMCRGTSDQTSGCPSAKALIAFTWLNAIFIFLYFVLLAFFSIFHQQEDSSVWHASTIDVPWFETKQCIRSNPTSPVASFSRFARAKPPSLVVPKPRRAGPPAPLFIHGRAGLGSRVEIEHFSDTGTLEAQAISPSIPRPALAYSSLYPQHVQHASQQGSLAANNNNVWNATYSSTQRRENASSPPPLGEWPRRESTTSSRPRRKREWSAATPQAYQPPQLPQAQMSERALGKQRSTAPPSRMASDASTASARSAASSSSSSSSRRRGPALEPLETRSVPRPRADTSPTSSQDSPSRSRPTGPRTTTGKAQKQTNGFVRPRPPPLDLTRKGATPTSSLRQ